MVIESDESLYDQFSEDWADSSMEKHDNFNFEAKIDYSLEKTPKKKTKYALDLFFFSPSSLQINEENYKKDQFFADLNNYIRFKTPKMAISGIVDEKNLRSPITNILKYLKYIDYGETNKALKRINYELRLLGCIVKVTLRDQFNHFFEQYKKDQNKKFVIEQYIDYLNDIESLQAKMRELNKKFLVSQIPTEIRESFSFSNDYISLRIELWLTKALKKLKESLTDEIKQKTIRIIENEQYQRKSTDSQLVIEKGKKNARFTYWESILKKYVQSVLYLERKPKNTKTSALELFYSVAAGLAMFFSLLISFIIGMRFEENSWPFIFALIVTYMIKDRIKDNIRRISDKALGIMFADRRYDIIDGFNEEEIGSCKETMHFLNPDEVPFQIMKIRHASNKSIIENKGKPENVFLYKKHVTLFNDKIEEIHDRQGDISDISRFNIKDFLTYTDDPLQKAYIWNSESKEVEKISAAKVYHLNLIFRLRSFEGEKERRVFYKKVRVILDQNGIRDVVEPYMPF